MRVQDSGRSWTRAIRIVAALRPSSAKELRKFDLLIEAPLLSVPNERWRRIEDDLRAAVSLLPLGEIHVIGDEDRSPWVSH
ncbi:hypothetical protein [Bradyrhizobium sp. B117]|uniref:hypothetical protein n=1 Tax=Bradyrhizobium sp. B117 TaxID=3140246 RepID=UPI0031835D43